MPNKLLGKLYKGVREKMTPWFSKDLLKELNDKEQIIWEMKRVIAEYKEFVENLADLAKDESEYRNYVKAKKRKAHERLSPFWDSLEYDIFLTLISDEQLRDQKSIHEFKVSTISINEAKIVCTAKVETYRECGEMRLDSIKTDKDSQNMGFGSNILDFLKNFCKSNGLQKIYGTIGHYPFTDEEILRKFYSKNNFVFSGHYFCHHVQ